MKSGFHPWVRTMWRRECNPTPIFLPGEWHGQRNLTGYSPWGCKESDMTERLSLSRCYNQIKGQSKEQEHLQIKNIEINTFIEAKLDPSRVKRRIKL